MDERSFWGLPPVLGSPCILFQAPAVVSEKVYIPLALVALFHYLGESAHPALLSNLLNPLKNSPSVTAESAVQLGVQFSFTQFFIRHRVLHEFSYLRAVKYSSLEFLHVLSFLYAYPWESKPFAFPVHCLHKVLYYS